MRTYTLTIWTKDGASSVKYLDMYDALDGARYQMDRGAKMTQVRNDASGKLVQSIYAAPDVAGRSSLEAAERAWARGEE